MLLQLTVQPRVDVENANKKQNAFKFIKIPFNLE